MLHILLVIQVVIALSMIGLVLLQHGKGADVGATFGAGSSATVFGSSGSMPFLMKVTIVVAVLFFSNSLAIGYYTTLEKGVVARSESALLKEPQKSTPLTPVIPYNTSGSRSAHFIPTQPLRSVEKGGK